MRVRAGSVYMFRPAGWDRTAPSHLGLTDGQRLRVVNLRGCPPANTMKHAHEQDLAGQIMGMVCTASLVKE
jgi:hypothetical protein